MDGAVMRSRESEWMSRHGRSLCNSKPNNVHDVEHTMWGFDLLLVQFYNILLLCTANSPSHFQSYLKLLTEYVEHCARIAYDHFVASLATDIKGL